jgi:hypothetical protein
MHRHGPAPLEGPISRSHPAWQQRTTSDEAAPTAPAAGAPPAGEGPAIRQELVERVRREIAEGTYDTPEKWEQALDRLWDELNRRD